LKGCQGLPPIVLAPPARAIRVNPCGAPGRLLSQIAQDRAPSGG
jgi:hypothetical protein